MPDLNFRTAAVRAEAKRIADHWLSRGIDGFRLDAARHLIEDGDGAGQNDTPETHAFWKEFAAEVRRRHPDALLVGEVWADTSVVATYYGSTGVPGGDELSMLFDFKLAEAIVGGVKAGDGARIAAKLDEVRRTYPPGAADAIFLTNHDQRRVASQLGNDRERLGLAAAILLTLPGSPFLYYGEEIGMQNGPDMNDEWKRTPMAWDASPGGGFTTGKPWYAFAPGQETANVAAEMHDPGSLLSKYRALLRARRASVALRRGELSPVASGSDAILAFTRRAGGETILVAHNLGEDAASGVPLAVPGTARAEPLYSDAGVVLTGASGAYAAVLPPRASGIWRLR